MSNFKLIIAIALILLSAANIIIAKMKKRKIISISFLSAGLILAAILFFIHGILYTFISSIAFLCFIAFLVLSNMKK